MLNEVVSKNLTKPAKKTIVIKDPIHGYVQMKHELIQKLLQTKEVQRLRHIFQLGVANMVYPTGTHTRFSHILGTYEIARRICNENKYFRQRSYEKMLFMCAALLHDVGHGPISHSFEACLEDFNHEIMGVKIIKSKFSEINKVLNEYDVRLVDDICDLISKQSKYLAVQSLISSDVDVDRMDYLLRDSYFTTNTLGQYDLWRIIYALNLDESGLYFNIHGVNVLEDFLIGRVHMYSQVYLHKKSLILDKIITMYLRRKIRSKTLDENSKLARFNKTRSVRIFNKLTDHHIFELLFNETDARFVPFAKAILYRDESDLVTKAKLDEDLDLELLYDPRMLKTKNVYNKGIKIIFNDQIQELWEVSDIIKLLNSSELKTQGEYKYYVKVNN